MNLNIFVHLAGAGEIQSIREALAKSIQLGAQIMTAISDFVANQNAFNDRLDAAIAGLTEDVKFFTDKIAEIQNSPGTLSAEDQAALDALTARGETITAKLEALDALTPPTPPAAPVE